MTERAQAQLEWLVPTDEPLDEIPLTSARAFLIETILAPLAGVDDLALNAAIEQSAADWLPLESEITQLARANSGGFGGMAGGGFAGGGFGGGGFGGSALSDGALSDATSDDEFVGGSGGSSDVASLAAIRGGDSASVIGARRADDAIAARSTGSSDATASLRTSGPRRHDGDANDRGKGNRGSNGGGSHPPRGSGGGPPETTSVPEPSSLLLMGLGLVSLARMGRRAAR